MALVQQHPALNRPERPACSICVANYNGVDLLGDCLDSIFSQQCDFTFEVIVHDDASPDASVKFLRERYPQVEVLASEENVGFCIGNNRMVAHARGEYILLLNNDAALFPDALAALMSDARQRSPQGLSTLPQHDWETGTLVDRGCLLDPFYNPVPNVDPRRADVAMAIGACLFLPRTVWNALGGFPEWFESIGEDLYLCCLARLHGIDVRVVPASAYRHRQGASFGGNRVVSGKLQTTFRRRRLSERNKTSVLVICTPTALVWFLLLLHITMLASEGLAMTVLGWNRMPWREIYGPAIRHACAARTTLGKRREQVQRERRTSLRRYLRGFVWLPRKLHLLLRHGLPVIR